MKTTTEIRPIPETYRRANTFTHSQIKRGEYTFIYKVVLDTSFGSKKANPVYYEVFKRMVNKGGIARFGGGPPVDVSPMERKPGDKSFGKWAWAVMDEAKALDIFEKMEAAKGDIKVFETLMRPDQYVFEFHKNGEPFTIKAGGNIVNKTIKVNKTISIEEAIEVAKRAFVSGFSSNSAVDARAYIPVLMEMEEEEEEDIEEEDENDD